MISWLKQVMGENPNWLRKPGSSLSFMKMSTPEPEYGAEESKVLVFVFEEGERRPTICAKTTRTYSAGEVIRNNYSNLQSLAEGVRGSVYADMFAKPLYLHDKDNLVFSLESVCPGVKFSLLERDTALVIEKYIGWQSHLATSTEKTWGSGDITDLANKTIKTLGLSGDSALVLRNYYKHLAFDSNVKLPVLVQHGDFTLDNVLIYGEQINLIDYDHVGISKLPGFDLFNLFLKSEGRIGLLRTNCERYLPQYFGKIGARIAPESYDSILFVHYLQERQRKMHLEAYQEKSGEEIVNSFRSLMAK